MAVHYGSRTTCRYIHLAVIANDHQRWCDSRERKLDHLSKIGTQLAYKSQLGVPTTKVVVKIVAPEHRLSRP